MKMKPAIAIVSMLLLVAGCAHEERYQAYQYHDESIAPSFSFGRVNNYSSEQDTPPPTGSAAVSGNADVNGKFMAGGTVGEVPSPSHGPGFSAEGQLPSQSQSDIAIIAHVRDSLEQDPEIALIAPNIQIAANSGAVVLDGTVQSDEQKRQIESITKRASGVVAVNNQLKIISSQGATGTDNSQLNPTGSAVDSSERLYQDPGTGANSSTNNLLNPTPLPGGPDEIYQQGNPGQNGQGQKP
jgi:hypothetical protein